MALRRQGLGRVRLPQDARPRHTAEADTLLLLCRAHGLPQPECEVVFHPTRKWRADYLWRKHLVILEREGGLFKGGKGGGFAQGGHSVGTGILRDMEKGNAAQLLGYRYLRATPRQIQRGEVLAMLQAVLSGVGPAQEEVIAAERIGRAILAEYEWLNREHRHDFALEFDDCGSCQRLAVLKSWIDKGRCDEDTNTIRAC